jgi:hypothetical protein
MPETGFASLDPKIVGDLQDYFLARTRGVLSGHLTTDGLYDIHRIDQCLATHGIAPSTLPTVPLDAACADRAVLTEPGQITLDPPHFSDHYLFRNRVFGRSAVTAFHFRDVYLSYNLRYLGRPEFYLFDSEKRLINGMLFGARPFLEDVDGEIAEPTVLIDDFFIKPNICHFLFDKLLRAFLSEAAFGRRQALMFHPFAYADVIADMLDVQIRSLVRKGHHRGTIRLRDLVVLSDSFNQLKHPGQIGSEAHLAVLARLRAAIPDPTGSDIPERYMLERAPDLPRNIVNADETRTLVDRFGFQRGDPATLPVLDQLQLFSRVKVLMGVHGAGLSNLAFQPPGSAVVELHGPMCGTWAYWVLANRMGHHYETVPCDDPEFGRVDPATVRHDPRNNRRDVVVPLPRLEEVLNRVL